MEEEQLKVESTKSMAVFMSAATKLAEEITEKSNPTPTEKRFIEALVPFSLYMMMISMYEKGKSVVDSEFKFDLNRR